jgi:hypothetical protein
MNQSRSTVFAAIVVSTFMVVQAHATAFRTFVSSTGSDTNTVTNCGLGAPCQHLSAAYGVTQSGGEIVALDSFGVGGVTITTPVTISALPGATAFVNAPASTTGIIINGGTVTLRNLAISGSNAANTTGVALNGGSLVVDGCRFSNLTSAGLTVNGGASSNVIVRNSEFSSNTKGLLAQSGAVDLYNNSFTNNSTAIRAEGQGPDQDSFTGGLTARVTVVRVSGGLIADNSTAFDMFNPGTTGTRAQGSCNAQNIFLKNDTTIVGNPTFLTASGLFDPNGGCTFPSGATIGGFASQNAIGSSIANQ